MVSSFPRIAALTLCAAAIGHHTAALSFAADAETAGIAIAIVDFDYVDTSERGARPACGARGATFCVDERAKPQAGNSAYLSQRVDLIMFAL